MWKTISEIFSFLSRPQLVYPLFLLILLLGAVPRIWLLCRVSEKDFYHNDGYEYMELSRQLAAGNGFSLSYYRWHEPVPPGAEPGELHTDLARTPLFPLLGAGLFFLPFDTTGSAKVVSLLLALLAVYCVFLLGREAAGNTCALWSALLFSFYPYALYYTISWSTENLFLICLALAFLFLLKACRGSFGGFWLSGLFLGLAALTRPTAILLPVVFLGVLWLRFMVFGAENFPALTFWKLYRPLPAGLWKHALLFVLAFALVMLPWMVRNKLAGGRWNPTTYYSGYVFWLSFSEIMVVTYETMDINLSFYTEATTRQWNEDHAKHLLMMKEQGITDFLNAAKQWKKWGWERIMKYPEKTWFILKERFFHYWRMCPNLVILKPWQIVLIRIYFTGLFVLALAGVFLMRKRFPLLILILPILFGMVISIPFLFVLRYRYPLFAPYICILGGTALTAGTEYVKRFIKRKKNAECV